VIKKTKLVAIKRNKISSDKKKTKLVVIKEDTISNNEKKDKISSGIK
jgi:hypothetical protein